MPTLLNICIPVDCLLLGSGLLGRLLLSKDAQLPGVLVVRGGLAWLTQPLASFSVVMLPDSSRLCSTSQLPPRSSKSSVGVLAFALGYGRRTEAREVSLA